MLSFREQLAKGHFSKSTSVKIPKKHESLGTIDENGYCDFDVPEDSWFLTREKNRANRMVKSERARAQRRNIRRINGCEE